MEFKGTKGTFKDGTTGWRYYSYKEDERVGFSTHEIHWSDDGECVAEVVHDEANAKLIAAAPELLKALQLLQLQFKEMILDEGIDVDDADIEVFNQATEAINKALN
jgi:hypothetical protein